MLIYLVFVFDMINNFEQLMNKYIDLNIEINIKILMLFEIIIF